MTDNGTALLHHRTVFDGWRSISLSVYMALVGYGVLVGIPVISTAWVNLLGFTEVQVGRVAGADLGGLSVGDHCECGPLRPFCITLAWRAGVGPDHRPQYSGFITCCRVWLWQCFRHVRMRIANRYVNLPVHVSAPQEDNSGACGCLLIIITGN